MNDHMKKHCLRLLRHPTDQSAMRALIEAVEEEAPLLATRLRDFVERGAMEPEGFILSEKMKELVKVPFVVIRIIPKPIAVRFACECAKKVLPLFEDVHPGEAEPRTLVEIVEAWTHGKATKTAVRDKLSQVQEFANNIDREWHTKYAEGAFDSLPKRDFELTNQPLFVIDVILAAAGAVIAAPDAALSNVDEVVCKCIEIESIDGDTGKLSATVAWQITYLEVLIDKANRI
jgi:hypothetical protein